MADFKSGGRGGQLQLQLPIGSGFVSRLQFVGVGRKSTSPRMARTRCSAEFELVRDDADYPAVAKRQEFGDESATAGGNSAGNHPWNQTAEISHGFASRPIWRIHTIFFNLNSTTAQKLPCLEKSFV